MAEQKHNWLKRIVDEAAIDTLLRSVAATGHGAADGSRGSSAILVAGAMAVKAKRTVLLVVAHLDDTDDAIEDLELFSAAGYPLNTHRFGALEVLPGESAVSLELLAERVQLVDELAAGQVSDMGVIVAPIQALMQSVPQAEALNAWSLMVEVGRELPLNELAQWLTDAGYQRVDGIEQPGDFAVRGGIVDIFTPLAEGEISGSGGGAIRLDFFGDEVDTISRIDPDTLASGDRLQKVRIIGASSQRIQSDERTTSLLSMLPSDTIVVMHELLELSEQARGYYERLTNPVGIYSPKSVFKSITQRDHVEINQYSGDAGRDTAGISLPLEQLLSFSETAKEAVDELIDLSRDHDVVVLCTKQAEQERLKELVAEHTADIVTPAALDIEVGYLHRGFVWQPREESGSLFLVPHHELFHRYDTRRRIRKISVGAADETGRSADAFLDLDVGQYVVHVDHGIARFTGLRTMRKHGQSEEYLTLAFADNALLHVPATQIELVQKYIGGFHGSPPLSKLGGKRWEKQKEQVREAVRDLAAELLRVQAARAAMPGIRYPVDTPWQKEFEAAFPYDETEDQLATMVAISKNMNDEQPMDRLICGDVGFGKTELAIRAAFKAAEYGKQVAVLVPTTVLAEQHERTFRERMADFPFRVESISRFKTAGEQAKVIKELATGAIDIVIGTHRLLSKDVKFADLGMVVIDEEQRFGVEHKHKLLQLRLTADILTLTATPIPRTLHMSMLGLRDISSLSTPPLDRRAIVTEVIPYNKDRIKQAIIREMNREGQVYFLHNRVHNIQSVADEIQQLVPDARIIIGHGQMPGKMLESVMLKFMRRRADVLVCTTIIESGIDIPTANTMIINNANYFGLAELHQLRGRVGRSKHRAYCYLLLPKDKTITETAVKRLRAIEQYSMLGAGFKIAMRDLEIRGAGNILGKEQSGHIAAVGYEMYCRLLEQETRSLNNEKVIEPVRTHLELNFTGQIPKRYISSDKFRMEAYRRISRANTFEEFELVIKSLTDAYGQPPEGAQMLLDMTELRIGASMLEIEGLKHDGPDLIFTTKNPGKLQPLLAGAPGRVSLIDEQTVYYRPPENYLEPAETLLAVLRKLLVRPAREGVGM